MMQLTNKQIKNLRPLTFSRVQYWKMLIALSSAVLDPHTKGFQEELEKVQNRAARFVTRNYTFEEGSMTWHS